MVVKRRDLAILKEPAVLDDDHQPDTVHHSEERVSRIEDYLLPAHTKHSPLHVWVYGKPGTGKTTAAKHLLEKMNKESGVRGIYINCWHHDSLYSILDHITAELRILRAEEQRTAHKLQKFQKHLKEEPFIIILDEMDKPSPKERETIIYSLCSMKKVGLICISNSCDCLFELDARVRSRLNPALVPFNSYSHDQLSVILTDRAQDALVEAAIEDGIIHKIAKLADGDARVALQTLKKAAWLAEKEHASNIGHPHIKRAWSSTRQLKNQYMLGKLTPDHRILNEILKSKNEILSSELRQLYLSECSKIKRKPVAERTFSDYINDLKVAGLAEVERARVRGKVRMLRFAG